MVNFTFNVLSSNASFFGLTSTVNGLAGVEYYNDSFGLQHYGNSSYSSVRPLPVNVSTDARGGDNNGSGNASVHGPPTLWGLTVYSHEHLVVTSVILGLFVLCCIIGNCFVIAAVILERSLHNVANYLILSLAVADLMVAVLVMPLSVVSEISQVRIISLSSFMLIQTLV
ncbi:type 1 serotonin receptor 5HT-1Hel [Biomphalaria glabrata]|nr:type 1 serotonin receptor 5HT-1Hel [Biomphalaria glabrata]KAI8792503.1 type 1 serotonin receptor 5HT-1Hel [Biomphalaria glabrata]